jgi:hypothetical protein
LLLSYLQLANLGLRPSHHRADEREHQTHQAEPRRSSGSRAMPKKRGWEYPRSGDRRERNHGGVHLGESPGHPPRWTAKPVSP